MSPGLTLSLLKPLHMFRVVGVTVYCSEQGSSFECSVDDVPFFFRQYKASMRIQCRRLVVTSGLLSRCCVCTSAVRCYLPLVTPPKLHVSGVDCAVAVQQQVADKPSGRNWQFRVVAVQSFLSVFIRIQFCLENSPPSSLGAEQREIEVWNGAFSKLQQAKHSYISAIVAPFDKKKKKSMR